MSTRSQLLDLLISHSEEYISGQQIGAQLEVSRNSIWKAIEQLRQDGYDIESKPSVGYRLVGNANIITKDAICSAVKYPCTVKVFDTVDSTNNVAKGEALSDKPLVVIAGKQTAGRGRLGRSFYSPSSTGLYMTLALTPSFDLDKSLHVTMAAAVAVTRAIEKVVGIKTKIKWVNDIFYLDRKICGILTEGQTNFETGKIDRLIIGIGVNCFATSLPDDIKNIAGAISTEKDSFSRNLLAAEIINELINILDDLESKKFLSEYRRKCFILGKNILIHPNYNSKAIKARAIDVDENGGLVVEYMEGPKMRQMETLNTGEISIKRA